MKIKAEAVHDLGANKFKNAVRAYKGKPLIFKLIPSWFLAILFKIAIEIIALILQRQAAEGIDVDPKACMPETLAEFTDAADHRVDESEDAFVFH